MAEREMTDEELLELLAERQYLRMTRSSCPYSALTDFDKIACRALVGPVLNDIRELEKAGAQKP